MKKVVRFIFTVTLVAASFARDDSEQVIAPTTEKIPYDAIINLGRDCQVAWQLMQHGLRTCALPFDVLVTPYSALSKMLEERFQGFMNPENLELVKNENGPGYILDKKYGTRFIHDFKKEEDFLKDYDAIAKKYTRRIERLLNLIQTSTYPLFIRKGIKKDEATHLQSLLLLLREGKPFALAALDETEEIKNAWNIKGVHNFYLRQLTPYSWKGDPEAWKEIFQILGLKITHT